MLHIIFPIAAPFIPIYWFFTKNILHISLNMTPITEEITGILVFPIPCNIPFTVCARSENMIETLLI